jgi:hypothetical protein
MDRVEGDCPFEIKVTEERKPPSGRYKTFINEVRADRKSVV